MSVLPSPDSQPEMIIDGHVHVFSPDLVRVREHLCGRDPWFGSLYGNPRARLADIDELYASMSSSGITTSVLCGFPWSDPGWCREHNDYMAACHRDDDRVHWLATVVPGDSGAVKEAERCFSLGASGIGELNADAQGFDFREPDTLADLVALCVERDRPIMFHVSEPVGHDYPGKGTSTPERFVNFLARYPDVKVVAAHWGGGLPFYELMPEVAELARNVWYDSAASTYLYRASVFPTVIGLVGSSRVVFGSDYPVLRQDRFLQRVRRLGLAPSTLSSILAKNAVTLFGLRREQPYDD